ncbi:hypothetical protein, partial [Treponema endosymbiont of Eucomonympha sp.]|uniref:hypothetical protein n=1 Tax=Treponema endosymbiont of Eucomonympha sp. TaxID=1580831 RepID=UPI001E468977
CLSGQQFFYPFPRLVAYIVPVNAFISFHASILPLFPYPVHTALGGREALSRAGKAVVRVSGYRGYRAGFVEVSTQLPTEQSCRGARNL